MSSAPVTQTNERDVNIPWNGEERGQLVFAGGIARLGLRGDATLTGLCRAQFDGVIPEVRASEGRVAITYPRYWPLGWMRAALAGGRQSADVTLNPHVPWEIAVRGGAAHLEADLSDVDARAFSITGGASHIALALGRPTGSVALRIGGGASEIMVRRPAGVPVRLSIHGGTSRLSFDEMRFGAIGGGFEWQSPDYHEASDRLEISIMGGASRVTIAET